MARWRKKDKKIDPSRLHPTMAQGLTQGKHALAEAKELPDVADPRDGAALARQVADVQAVEGTRVPRPQFHAEDSTDSVWTLGDDRLQRNSVQTFSPETLRAMREGHMCLRCYEPQETAFPVTCDLCGYAMRERQIMDIAMEFEGERHLGPAKPISEYMLDQELEREKREFEERQQDGGKKIVMPRDL